MHLNFKFLIGVLLCVQIGWSQEKKDDQTTSPKKTETFFEVAFSQPLTYGDNFINKGYDLSPTIDLGVITGFYFKTTLHFDLTIGSGDVVRPDLIGNISSSVFTRVSTGVGYPIGVIDKLNFLPSLHIGYLKIGSTIEDEKFRDDGIFVNAEVTLNYSVFKWIDLSLGAKNYFDFIRIEAPSDIQSFFNNAQSISPFIGLRFKI